MMAPISISKMASSSQKRARLTSETDFHPAKKLRQSYHRYHSLQYKAQSIPPAEPAILKQTSLDKLLVDSIKAICEEQGARQGIQDPIIESLALEAFRNAAEECKTALNAVEAARRIADMITVVLRVCATVRRSMLSARRTMPVATDFETAIRALDLPWPFDQLGPYTTTPATNPPLLPTPPPEDLFHKVSQLPTSFLGPGLDGREDKKKDLYIPSNFPAFPSKHTYKDTPVFPTREVDPRRIRELATEEGKLGEEALRKLAGAIKAENTISVEKEILRDKAVQQRARQKQEDDSIEDMFKDTMRELLKEQGTSTPQKFELAPKVNCERRFWMQDAAPSRWKDPVAVGEGRSDRMHGGGQALSAKARGKQKAEDFYLEMEDESGASEALLEA